MRLFSTWLKLVLDILFPPRSDRAFVDIDAIISSLPPEEIGSEYIHALFRYKELPVKKLVLQIKYYGNKKITAICGQILYSYIVEELSDQLSFNDFTAPLLIPIPLSAERRKERGYNQCECLIDEMKKYDPQNHFEASYDLLIKSKNTTEQKSLKRKDRLKNLHNIFQISDPGRICNRNIIIIDDVCTTGATFEEACHALLQAGARNVLCLAVAH
jgi:ComF family protein